MKQTKFKGSFSDLKPALKSLKSLMESAEDDYMGGKKQNNGNATRKRLAGYTPTWSRPQWMTPNT